MRRASSCWPTGKLHRFSNGPHFAGRFFPSLLHQHQRQTGYLVRGGQASMARQLNAGSASFTRRISPKIQGLRRRLWLDGYPTSRVTDRRTASRSNEAHRLRGVLIGLKACSTCGAHLLTNSACRWLLILVSLPDKIKLGWLAD